MSLHLHDENGYDIGYVCKPGPVNYKVAVHRVGAKRWELWSLSNIIGTKSVYCKYAKT